MISFNTHNYTTLPFISQENYFTSLDVALSSKLFSELFQLQGNGNHPTIAIVMNELLHRENTGKSLTVSQQAIATKVGKTTGNGLTRLQAGKILRTLEVHGAITRLTPHHKNHTYIPSPIFKDKALRLALKHLLSELDDERVSERKREADEICAMKAAKMYWSQSYREEALDLSNSNYDFEAHQQKMHHSLKGIYSINADEFVCDDGAILNNDNFYTYNYTEPTKGVIEDIFSPVILLKSESICVPNKKGSTAMQALPTVQEILPYADQLKSICPLLHGAIILSAFPQEVVLHADERTLKCKKPLNSALDRWKYLISVCKGYCAENKIETSWTMSLNIRDKYSIHKDTPMFDENHSPVKVHTPISFKKGTGIEAPMKQVTYAEAVKNNQQWANSAPHIDKEKEFSGALDTLTEMAASNPFAALLMKSVEKLKPQIVGHHEPMVRKLVEPFDQDTLDIVEWIQSNWDDKLFPHSNKWVHDNIARLMKEGTQSAQYLDGSFMHGMKRIKLLMQELLKKPVLINQSTTRSAQIVQDIAIEEISEDYSEDPFGDKI